MENCGLLKGCEDQCCLNHNGMCTLDTADYSEIDRAVSMRGCGFISVNDRYLLWKYGVPYKDLECGNCKYYKTGEYNWGICTNELVEPHTKGIRDGKETAYVDSKEYYSGAKACKRFVKKVEKTNNEGDKAVPKQTYYTKCGREFEKNSTAVVTGYDIDLSDPECANCPFRVDVKEGWPPIHKKWECRAGSQPPNHTAEWIGSIENKNTIGIHSLDNNFLESIIEYCKAHSELSASYNADHLADCRRTLSINCSSNKKGIAAKRELIEKFFPDGNKECEDFVEKKEEKGVNNLNELSKVRPLELIEAEINFYKGRTADGIIEIGKRLIEAKEQISHGEWGKWLEEKVDFSQNTAGQFMRVAREFSNSESIANLGTRKLFLLLDVPSDEREEFIKENPVETMTTRELQEAIKAKKELEEKLKQETALRESVQKRAVDLRFEKEKAENEIVKLRKQLTQVQAQAEHESESESDRHITKIEELAEALSEKQQIIIELEKQLKNKPIEATASRVVEKIPEDLQEQMEAANYNMRNFAKVNHILEMVENLSPDEMQSWAAIMSDRKVLDETDESCWLDCLAMAIRNLQDMMEDCEQRRTAENDN
jgi:hypothetical protein